MITRATAMSHSDSYPLPHPRVLSYQCLAYSGYALVMVGAFSVSSRCRSDQSGLERPWRRVVHGRYPSATPVRLSLTSRAVNMMRWNLSCHPAPAHLKFLYYTGSSVWPSRIAAPHFWVPALSFSKGGH